MATANDASPVDDNVEVNQANPQITQAEDGQIIHPEGVKGPDPEVWGEPADRPDPFLSEATGAPGIPLDTVTDEGVKGPSSEEWQQDDDGNYVNR